jgi:hypothetical protein
VISKVLLHVLLTGSLHEVAGDDLPLRTQVLSLLCNIFVTHTLVLRRVLSSSIISLSYLVALETASTASASPESKKNHICL